MSSGITEYIHQDNWVQLGEIFTCATGQIGKWGGRYCSHRLGGSLYLEEICWGIFSHVQNHPLNQLPNEQRRAANNVLTQLRRIYNETEQLLKTCSLATVITRFYDVANLRHDGYRSGVERLEEYLESDLTF